MEENKFTNYIDKIYTFENFDVNDSNQLAYSMCKNIVLKKSKQINPIFLYGENLGKTHLLKAIEDFDNKKVFNACYISINDFKKNYVNALKEKRVESFENSFNNYNVLLIDDFENLSGKEETQKEILYLVNKFILDNKQVVIASHESIDLIAGLSKKLKNRISCGMIITIG
jgi:chromosomal replication initiator protein